MGANPPQTKKKITSAVDLGGGAVTWTAVQSWAYLRYPGVME